MPQGDRTGPSGQGPMTGRRRGFCAGFNIPGFMNSGFGRGMGRGFGRGRGFERNFTTQPEVITEKQEKELLREELKTIEEEKKEIEKRLKG